MCGILCLIQFEQPLDLQLACKCLDQLGARGPDKKSYHHFQANELTNVFMGFTRLAIMDTSDDGQQPFYDDEGNIVICNGEIYNYQQLAKDANIKLNTNSDCEIILPWFRKHGFEKMIKDDLDAEFAMLIYEKKTNTIYASRDRFGVRPLYYGFNRITKTIGFASELKALHPIMEFVEQVKPNQIATIHLDNVSLKLMSRIIKFNEYYSYPKILDSVVIGDKRHIQTEIHDRLTEAVNKRLVADRPIGFLLSGGLDSSLIVAIATKILGPDKIVCFSIGIEGSPDVEAAKKVVNYLQIKNHHIIPFTTDMGLEALPDVIRTIETYDITTIRASTPQYLMAKYIHEKTDIRVLLSGEGSDEIACGYKYFRYAPNASELHRERIRLLEELCYFDNQRTDRTMAGNSLEVRVPFLDFNYVEFITKLDPELLVYKPDYIEKTIIRDSFKGYLPDDILYRPKEAFSDAVSSKEIVWYHAIRDKAETSISDNELLNCSYSMNPPELKEALYYRKIFDQFYPKRDNVIPHYWLPKFIQQKDPSATVL